LQKTQPKPSKKTIELARERIKNGIFITESEVAKRLGF
jgi:hypothetical protein